MSDPSHKILMVIPSIEGGSLLERMLPTLRFAPSSIVVLDQGSTDTTEAVCAAAGVEIVQLGHPHTYTQACNIGADLARSRGLDYVCVSNNDIVFRTDVMGEMLAEMERDMRLGIVAPSQNIIEENSNEQPLSYRVFWNLDRVDFFHDTHPAEGAATRLESDFCELTCALVRLSAINEIGFLDDEFGFYHEDADFGFRLRQAGYSCAYLPAAQIDHFSSSTFNQEKLARKADYIAKNKLYFAEKHLGLGVHLAEPDPRSEEEKDVSTGRLYSYLKRFGLIDKNAPELVLSHADADTSDYLYT
ncbi:MAG: glycosyltransferase family 2 protein, partial [Hyphomicrobiales bacterium]